MAATWKVKLEVVCPERCELRLTATRTDDSVSPPLIDVHTLDSLVVSEEFRPLGETRQMTVEQLRAKHLAVQEHRDVCEAMLDEWEVYLETDLNALEEP